MIDSNIKLDEDYVEITTEDEREKLRKMVKTDSTWLEDDATFETPTKEYIDRLKALKEAFKDVFFKEEQLRERPKIDEAFKAMLNYSTVFLAGSRNMSEDDQIFTETEMGTLEKVLNETRDWWGEKQKEQAALKSHDMPAITIQNAGEKISALEREVKYLLGKARYAQPLKKKEKKENKTETATPENKTETVAPENVTETVTPGRDEKVATEKPEESTQEPKAETLEKSPDGKEETDTAKPETPSEEPSKDSKTSETDEEKHKEL